MTVDSGCAVVASVATRPEFTVTREVQEQLADFALACRVRIALATNLATRSLELEVSAARGLVTVAGEVPEATMITHVSTRWERELRSVVEGVAGVEGLDLRITPFNPRA